MRRALLEETFVAVADEFVDAFDQGELCRHTVTVPGTDLVIDHA